MPLVRFVTATALLLALAGAVRADDDSLPPPRPPTPKPVPAPPPAPAPAPAPIPVAPPPAAPVAPPPAAPVAPPPAPAQPPPAEPTPTPPPPPGVPPVASPAADPGAASPIELPAAPPTVAVPPEGDLPVSLEDIARRFDEEEKAARRDVRRRRYDATLAYLRGHPMASEVEEARGALVTLAFEAEAWDLVPPRADEFLMYHRATPLAAEVLYDKAVALAKLGRQGEGRAAYGELTRSVGLKSHGKSVVMRAWSSYAIWLADLRDLEGAKNAWRGLRAVFQTLPDAEGRPFMNMADDEIKYLDLVAKPPPAFPAGTRDLEGRPISLDDYRGRYVLIDFWATWCKPCKEELPNVLDAYRRHHAKGFDVVGIVVNEPTDGAKVRDFVLEHRMPWRQIHFTAMRNPIAPAYGVYGVPYTMLLGPDGRVIRVGLRGAELRTTLERLFAAK